MQNGDKPRGQDDYGKAGCLGRAVFSSKRGDFRARRSVWPQDRQPSVPSHQLPVVDSQVRLDLCFFFLFLR
jgi:hypothetical protein